MAFHDRVLKPPWDPQCLWSQLFLITAGASTTGVKKSQALSRSLVMYCSKSAPLSVLLYLDQLRSNLQELGGLCEPQPVPLTSYVTLGKLINLS